jgi:pyrroloquinoline quinone (PQQ) biosynthesis protein C
VLNDIEAAGGDRARAAESQPLIATEAMVAYAYDLIARRNPVGLFGMVYVLEGTSATLALRAAATIQKTLQLPPRAFTYLRSHGQLDQEHTQHLEDLLERLTDASDRAAVEHSAQAIYWLYGQVFRSLDLRGAGSAVCN